jgi:ActR/RegA family two-component response regulator
MLRYRQPRARIIFVTGYPDLAAVAAELPGKVFTKPVDLDAVASEIRSQLAA